MIQQDGIFTTALFRDVGLGYCLIANTKKSDSYPATIGSCDALAFLRVAPAGGNWRIAKTKYGTTGLQFLSIDRPFDVMGVYSTLHWEDAGLAERPGNVSYWDLPRLHRAQKPV
jgi:hypothetical protein